MNLVEHFKEFDIQKLQNRLFLDKRSAPEQMSFEDV